MLTSPGLIGQIPTTLFPALSIHDTPRPPVNTCDHIYLRSPKEVHSLFGASFKIRCKAPPARSEPSLFARYTCSGRLARLDDRNVTAADTAGTASALSMVTFGRLPDCTPKKARKFSELTGMAGFSTEPRVSSPSQSRQPIMPPS